MAQDNTSSLTDAIPEGAQMVTQSIEQAALDIWNFKIATVEDASIDNLFRKDDVVIAFPQRDVHLFQPSPLRVEVSHPAKERV